MLNAREFRKMYVHCAYYTHEHSQGSDFSHNTPYLVKCEQSGYFSHVPLQLFHLFYS